MLQNNKKQKKKDFQVVQKYFLKLSEVANHSEEQSNENKLPKIKSGIQSALSVQSPVP